MSPPWLPTHDDLLRRPEYAALAGLVVQLDLAVAAVRAAYPYLATEPLDCPRLMDDTAEFLALDLIRNMLLLRRETHDYIRFMRAPPDRRPNDIPF